MTHKFPHYGRADLALMACKSTLVSLFGTANVVGVLFGSGEPYGDHPVDVVRAVGARYPHCGRAVRCTVGVRRAAL